MHQVLAKCSYIAVSRLQHSTRLRTSGVGVCQVNGASLQVDHNHGETLSLQRRHLPHGDLPGLKTGSVHGIRFGSPKGVDEILGMELGYLVLRQFQPRRSRQQRDAMMCTAAVSEGPLD